MSLKCVNVIFLFFVCCFEIAWPKFKKDTKLPLDGRFCKSKDKHNWSNARAWPGNIKVLQQFHGVGTPCMISRAECRPGITSALHTSHYQSYVYVGEGTCNESGLICYYFWHLEQSGGDYPDEITIDKSEFQKLSYFI